jgi:ArsR family transcriptional regulator
MKVVEVPMDNALLEQIADPKPNKPIDAGTSDQEPMTQQSEEVESEESPGSNRSEEIVMTFKMLSDETRLAIMRELATGPKNVATLCDSIRLPQPTVSHHLALMRRIRLAVCRRQGKEKVYSIDQDRIRQAADLLQHFLSR